MNGNQEIKMQHIGVEMGHKWGIMLHLLSLAYGSVDKVFACFANIQMSHGSFYGKLGHWANK